MFNDFPVLQAKQFSDSESWVVCLSRQMNVQRDQVVVGQHFRNYDFQLWVLLLHFGNELDKAVWTIDHLRTVLAVGELNVFTSGLGRLSLVDCEFVEFGYDPFVVIEYVSRVHGRLLASCCWTLKHVVSPIKRQGDALATADAKGDDAPF
jgi:hypothetical protein